MRFDPVSVIEACYRSGADPAWASGVLDALGPLEQGGGSAFFAFGRTGRTASVLARRGALPDVTRLVSVYQDAPPAILGSHLRASPPVDRASRRGAVGWRPLGSLLATVGMDDVLGIMATEHDGESVFVWIPIRAAQAPAPRTVHQLTLVAAHLLSARRLRRHAAGAPLQLADAVCDTRGEIREARGGAVGPGIAVELSAAVRRIELARGQARREDPEAALALWSGLVAGEWSLVDHVDTDQRRFVLARRNPPGVRDPKALTARERDVLGYVALGHSNKYVAYMLGLAPTTVAGHLQAAQRKLGVRSRVELITAFGGAPRDGLLGGPASRVLAEDANPD